MAHAPASLLDRLGDMSELMTGMSKQQMRDSAYYEERLKRDQPAIYADLKAGKYATVTEAAIAAGLKKTRTRLHELKNAWPKASAVEQADFLHWLAGLGVTMTTSAPPTAGAAVALITVDNKLTPPTSKRIEDIMLKRGMRPGDVMDEMGFPKRDTSVSMALARGTKIRPDVITALEGWLTANASV
jgi:hypothetical protein